MKEKVKDESKIETVDKSQVCFMLLYFDSSRFDGLCSKH